MEQSLPLIYHELQESSLCGMHCLNNLLQYPLFTEADLSEIANELNKREKMISASGENSYNHANDTGNFSVEVLIEALKRLGLNLSYLIGQTQFRDINFYEESGFVLNLSSHWFALRKIGGIFYDLDSLKKCPVEIGQIYLETYIESLKQSGHSVFVVKGKFPFYGMVKEKMRGVYWEVEDIRVFSKNYKKDPTRDKLIQKIDQIYRKSENDNKNEDFIKEKEDKLIQMAVDNSLRDQINKKTHSKCNEQKTDQLLTDNKKNNKLEKGKEIEVKEENVKTNKIHNNNDNNAGDFKFSNSNSNSNSSNVKVIFVDFTGRKIKRTFKEIDKAKRLLEEAQDICNGSIKEMKIKGNSFEKCKESFETVDRSNEEIAVRLVLMDPKRTITRNDASLSLLQLGILSGRKVVLRIEKE